MRSLLWEVGAFDPAAGATAVALAVGLALARSLPPARRLLRADPLAALKE